MNEKGEKRGIEGKKKVYKMEFISSFGYAFQIKLCNLMLVKTKREGGVRDLFDPFYLAIKHVTVFFIAVSCFLCSIFGKSTFLDTRTELSNCKFIEQLQWL